MYVFQHCLLHCFFVAKVLSFNKMRALPDAYTFSDGNVRLEVQGEIGYRYDLKAGDI